MIQTFERIILLVGALMLAYVTYLLLAFGYFQASEDERLVAKALIGEMQKGGLRDYPVFSAASRKRISLTVYGLNDKQRQDRAAALLRKSSSVQTFNGKVVLHFKEKQFDDAGTNSRTVTIKEN